MGVLLQLDFNSSFASRIRQPPAHTMPTAMGSLALTISLDCWRHTATAAEHTYLFYTCDAAGLTDLRSR